MKPVTVSLTRVHALAANVTGSSLPPARETGATAFARQRPVAGNVARQGSARRPRQPACCTGVTAPRLRLPRENAVNASDERTRSLWMRVDVLPDAADLEGSLKADTVIVGSGIAGLSAAYELAGAGQKVVVVDRGAIAGGMTSRTTAHLAPICDDGLSTLIGLRGVETAKLFQQSQAAAVDRIEAIVDRLAIRCDFRRLDGYLFPAVGHGPRRGQQAAGQGIRGRPQGRRRRRARPAACR